MRHIFRVSLLMLPPFSFDFKGCGLCAAPLTGSFKGVSLKRNERMSFQKTREGNSYLFPLKENPSREGGSCPPHGFFWGSPSRVGFLRDTKSKQKTTLRIPSLRLFYPLLVVSLKRRGKEKTKKIRLRERLRRDKSFPHGSFLLKRHSFVSFRFFSFLFVSFPHP